MASELDIKIDGESLDLFDNEEKNFYLTKVIHDLTNLETRNADFSKTIAIPLTSRNQTIIDDNVPMIERFNDGAVSSLNAEVLVKGVPVLEDASILVGDQDTKNRTLSISVIAGSARFFNQLQNIPIANLNLSEYNLEWTIEGIRPIAEAPQNSLLSKLFTFSIVGSSTIDYFEPDFNESGAGSGTEFIVNNFYWFEFTDSETYKTGNYKCILLVDALTVRFEKTYATTGGTNAGNVALEVTSAGGIAYANSLWYSNKSRSLFDAKGGIGSGFGNYLDSQEIGESGFFIYLKTILDKIFFNLDDLTVDDSKLDAQYLKSALAVAVPIVHDSFVETQGYFTEVATPHIEYDEALYSQLVQYNSVLSDDDALFVPPFSIVVAQNSFCVIKASFDVLRSANFPYYTRIQILVNGNIIDEARFEYTGDASDVIECSITTSYNLLAGDSVQVQIANQNGAYITDNSDGTFSVEAQGSGRGRYLEVSSVLPEISQRAFVKEVFKLFNIIPTTQNKVVTLNYFEEIGNNKPLTFDLNKLKTTTVKSTLFSYGQENVMKYQDNEAVERLDANSSFNVNSNTLEKTVIKIESLYSATDDSIVIDKDLVLPNYELEWWLVTDNKLTVALGSPNYSTADRNNIELGDFIYSEAGSTVRKRVIAIIDDFSGICDANFESNAPSFDWQHWRYTKNELLLQIATIDLGTGNHVLVWDGGASNYYDSMYVANFSGLKWNELKAVYYQLLVDALFKPFTVTAWVYLDTVKFISVNGLDPIYVEEYDAYFYLNKLEQWKYEGNARCELIQIPI